MELTKRKTADKAKDIDEIAAKKVKEDSFVDDISTGGTEDECQRFKGEEDPSSLACDGTMPQILSVVGMDVKAMAKTGEPDGPALHKLGAAVLGMGFSTETDLMKVRFKVNISDYKKGKPTGPDLELSTLAQLDDVVITKRKCLRIVSSQYDPLGIAAPLTIILKVNLKELYKLGVDWDMPLLGEVRNTWVKLFRMLGVQGQRGQLVTVCLSATLMDLTMHLMLWCMPDGRLSLVKLLSIW